MEFDETNPLVILQNNTPQEDLCGMTPSEIHHLLYDAWTELSPISVYPGISEDILDQVPYFRLAEELVRILSREKQVKLTAHGFLPQKIVRELYDHRFIPDFFVDMRNAKVVREHDSAPISSVHSIVKASGLVKNVKNKLILTKKGELLALPDARARLLLEVMKTFTQKWDWGNLDGYEEAYGIQQLWGFSVHLLSQFGHEEQKATFYSQKFLLAFPLVAEQFPTSLYSNPIEDFDRCYCIRTVEQFFEWWGLVKVDNARRTFSHTNRVISATPLVKEVFRFE